MTRRLRVRHWPYARKAARTVAASLVLDDVPEDSALDALQPHPSLGAGGSLPLEEVLKRSIIAEGVEAACARLAELQPADGMRPP